MTEYLVKRATTEPNLHILHMDFLDNLVDSPLAGLVLQETYKHIGFALNADLSFHLSFDKVILKNLGHWLSLQTFARCVRVSVADLLNCGGHCHHCFQQRLS